MHITSIVLIRKFQTSWFKIPLLGEAETPISLSTLCLVKWLNKSDFTLACFFLFFFLNNYNSEYSFSLSSVSHSSQLSSLRGMGVGSP